MNRYLQELTTAALFLSLLLAMGCATSQETTSDDQTTAEADSAAVDTEREDEFSMLLSNNRSQLNDLHISQQHDMPEAYLKKKDNNEAINSNPEDGYRIQILSTRDMELADSTSIEFRAWADTTIQGYTAQSYVSFNQPFYRVHVGDFQQRKKANSYSKLIKNRFPDAWVVHDRIEPESVPADTASFSLMTEEDRQQRQQADTLDHQ